MITSTVNTIQKLHQRGGTAQYFSKVFIKIEERGWTIK
jgi:hypothetical protein